MSQNDSLSLVCNLTFELVINFLFVFLHWCLRIEDEMEKMQQFQQTFPLWRRALWRVRLSSSGRTAIIADTLGMNNNSIRQDVF
jgi:hypothetical protein